MPREELDAYCEFVNAFHPAIKYEFTISEESIPMLDTKLYIKDRRIESTIFYKPTDGHAYLKYDSEHPVGLKKSIPYSQFLRLKRIISEEDTFLEKAEEMSAFLINRDYPRKVVRDALRKANNISREEALTPKTKPDGQDILTFPLTFSSMNRKVAAAILKRYISLQNDPLIGKAFTLRPTIAYKRGPCLGKSLTCTKITESVNNIVRGTFPCKHKLCKCCIYTNEDPVFIGPKGSVNAEGRFTCSTRQVIYCISCKCCPSIYIGETGKQLKTRFQVHRRDVERYTEEPSSVKNPSKVVKHFSEPGHSVSDMLVGIICVVEDRKERMDREQKIIAETGAYRGECMNIDFNYLFCVDDNL